MKIRTLLAAAAATATMAGGTLAATAPAANAWLNPGPSYQYPSNGGTWEYGFWNVKVRSYYTVNRCHGSSVRLNGNLVRSVDTAKNKKSIAEKTAVNTPGGDDQYYYRTC